jgi:hypothetical protein
MLSASAIQPRCLLHCFCWYRAPGEVPPAELRSRQAARVAQLTAALASILRRYVEEDVEGFTVSH